MKWIGSPSLGKLRFTRMHQHRCFSMSSVLVFPRPLCEMGLVDRLVWPWTNHFTFSASSLVLKRIGQILSKQIILYAYVSIPQKLLFCISHWEMTSVIRKHSLFPGETFYATSLTLTKLNNLCIQLKNTSASTEIIDAWTHTFRILNFWRILNYSHAPHKHILVNVVLHIQWRSHEILMELENAITNWNCSSCKVVVQYINHVFVGMLA